MMDGLHNRIGRALVLLGWTAVILAPFLAHLAIASGRFVNLAIVLAVVQATVLAVLAYRQPVAWRWGLGAAALALVIVLLLSKTEGTGWLVASSGVSHAAIYGALLALFGASLRRGHSPIATRMALRARGTLTPDMIVYTRNVTKAWCVFCLGQLAGSLVLLVLAPEPVWSWFVNVLDGPLVVALFLGEYAVRRWRFRHERHSSPLAVARAFARDRAGG